MNGEVLGRAAQPVSLRMSLEGEILRGHYKIEEKLAQGGTSWLYRATHLLLEETMAFKLLYPHLLENPSSRLRFLHEAQIQFRLKHPNIVQVTEIIAERDLLGIMQEWVEGPSLKTYLLGCRRVLSLGQIRYCMEPLLDALDYAHRQGVVHRDVKPSNVLLQRERGMPWLIPKLSDFGVAKMLGARNGQTEAGTMLGTFNYIAPEQIRDSKAVDARSDIYGVGVMLYQLATGHLPFKGNFERLMFQHLTERPPDPREFNRKLTAEMSSLILRCMAKDPDDRFENCRELSTALSQICPEAQTLFPHPTRRTKEFRAPPMQGLEPPPETNSETWELDISESAYLSMQDEEGSASASAERRQSSSFRQPAGRMKSFVDAEIVKALKGEVAEDFRRENTEERMSTGEEEVFSSPYDSSSAIIPPVENRCSQQWLSDADAWPQAGELKHRISKSLRIPKFEAQESLELDLLSELSAIELSPPALAVSHTQVLEESTGSVKETRGLQVLSRGWSVGVLFVLCLGAGGWWYMCSSSEKAAQTKSQLPSFPPPQDSEGQQEPKSRPSLRGLAGAASCEEGKARPCYTGKHAWLKRGRCRGGVQRCRAGKWEACLGARLPLPERCNGIDDDCDGLVDEGFARRGERCTLKEGACRFQGRWACSASGKKLRCQEAKTFLGRGRPLRLSLYPSHKHFRVRVGRKYYRLRGRSCVPASSRLRVAVTGKGYQLCLFSISRKKRYRLRMKRRSEIEAMPSYCLH